MAAAPPAGGRAALVFALAAVAACWNPVAAPFGLAVGVGAALLAVAARRRGARRTRTTAALLLGAVAAVSSAAVLALSAGTVTNEIPGTPVVKARSSEEANRVLDDAAGRTRAERDRARAELEQLEKGTPGGRAEPPVTPSPRPGNRDRR